jgi:hypothetical protein
MSHVYVIVVIDLQFLLELNKWTKLEHNIHLRKYTDTVIGREGNGMLAGLCWRVATVYNQKQHTRQTQRTTTHPAKGRPSLQRALSTHKRPFFRGVTIGTNGSSNVATMRNKHLHSVCSTGYAVIVYSFSSPNSCSFMFRHNFDVKNKRTDEIMIFTLSFQPSFQFC